MRLLLDASDLVDIIQFDRPITTDALQKWLGETGSAVVLSFTSINDFVGKSFQGNRFLEMRPMLQRIETLPNTYIREGTILVEELREAYAAFMEKRLPQSIKPYVRRWDETGFWVGEPATRMLVGMRLDDLVFMARRSIQAYKQFVPGLRLHFTEERRIPPDERHSLKQIFIDGMRHRFAAHNIAHAPEELRRFGGWLWKNPTYAPGLRLFFEAHHMRMRDAQLEFADGDIADFQHIASIPYADLVTMDKRIHDLVGRVFQKLQTTCPAMDYSSRVSRHTTELLRTIRFAMVSPRA